MAKRSGASDDGEAPRSIHVYLLLGVVAVVVIAGAYMSRDAITALIVDTMVNPDVSAPIAYVQSQVQSTEPACVADCGQPCWLSAGRGEIGVLDCGGACKLIAESINSCCRSAECPKGALCEDGVCR